MRVQQVTTWQLGEKKKTKLSSCKLENIRTKAILTVRERKDGCSTEGQPAGVRHG